jgi:RNA polymerase sigma-70 factor (ECF subfamily)
MGSPALQLGMRRELIADLVLVRKNEWDAVFAGLVQEHARLLYRIAYAVVRNQQDAEDAVQDVFLKAYRAQPNPQDARAYLARAAYRSALDRLPRKDTRPIADHEDFRAETPSQEDLATGWSDQQRLHRLIDGLPEDLRQPLLLTAIKGLTSREVAAILGIPEGTVRTRSQRAREELRKRLERRKA